MNWITDSYEWQEVQDRQAEVERRDQQEHRFKEMPDDEDRTDHG